MEPVRRAVIDIGTNSVKLLVAEIRAGGVAPIVEKSRQTRLGKNFYQTHRLAADRIAATAEAVAQFAVEARQSGAESVRPIATSAARDAVNSADLCAAVQRSCGLRLEIISGQQEADWGFRGVTTDPRLAATPLLLLEVGGGSSQFIVGCGPAQHFACSYPLGTVRLLEKLPHSDPPTRQELAQCRDWLKAFLRDTVAPQLTPALEHELRGSPGQAKMQWVGIGGTASILGCMEARLESFDRERLEQTRLTRERLQWHTDFLWSVSLEQRKKVTGLPANRADVILTGVAIFEAVADQFGFHELVLSTRGPRFGAVLETSIEAT